MKEFYIDVEGVKKYIKENFRGRLNWFCEEFNITYITIQHLLNNIRTNESPVIASKILMYCITNNVDHTQFFTTERNEIKKIKKGKI